MKNYTQNQTQETQTVPTQELEKGLYYSTPNRSYPHINISNYNNNFFI